MNVKKWIGGVSNMNFPQQMKEETLKFFDAKLNPFEQCDELKDKTLHFHKTIPLFFIRSNEMYFLVSYATLNSNAKCYIKIDFKNKTLERGSEDKKEKCAIDNNKTTKQLLEDCFENM